MSVSYDIGFTKKLKLDELDVFMQSKGFEIEDPGQRSGEFTRVYVFLDEKVAAREIELFFTEDPEEFHSDLFDGREIESYACLKTYSSELPFTGVEERLKVIKENNVRTEYGWTKHLDPGRLKFYETALVFKTDLGAVVISEQSGEEIDPDRVIVNN